MSRLPLAALAVLLIVAGLASASAAREDLPSADPDWFEGAAGFARGFEQAEAEGRPVLVYFYADWCGYCRQLEANLLERPTVQDYTQYLIKVRVNPEKGSDEREIADSYGVRGYPAVFVHSHPTEGPLPVRRMVRDSGKRRLMTPEEYVEMLAAATGERFGSS